MKDSATQSRLILSFWDICLDNLPEGKFIKRKLDPTNAVAQINAAVSDGALLAVSKNDLFAPYHETAMSKTKELCNVLASDFGISISIETFFDRCDGEDGKETCHIVPLQIVTILKNCPMIVITCMYEMGDRTKTDPMGFRVSRNSISFFEFTVVEDGLK